jgi:N-methylhydantoinase B
MTTTVPRTGATDPVTVEVVRNTLAAIADEMALDLQQGSYNMMIYEVRDFCCALIDKQGRLLAQNVGGVSHFVADLGVIITDALERFGEDGFRPGDGYLMNHQRVAGQHLNNMVTYTPVIIDGELFGFAMTRAHWSDVGGMSTGFGARGAGVDAWLEGLQIDQLKLIGEGVYDEKALKIIADNIRFPEAALGDMRAQFAACRAAEQRLTELVRRYGVPEVQTAIEEVFDSTEARCRSVVEAMADGEYRARSVMDHDFADLDVPVEIDVTVTVSGSDMTIDLTRCSEQRKGSINARTLAGAYVGYKALTTPMEPVNEGSFRALNVKINEGNFMMAKFPAPMASWSVALPTVVDTVIAALADAQPDLIPAAHFGTLGGSFAFFGQDPESGPFVAQGIEGGGWGGRPGEDGASASVSVCQGDVRNSPVEALELRFPVRVEKRALREDSGGAGKHRGGLGQLTEIRNLVEGSWRLSMAGRHVCPPWGLWGGEPALPGGHALQRPGGDFEPVNGRVNAPADSVARIFTGGGGGWGSPLERPTGHVAHDVRRGYVSAETATNVYGVVLDESGEPDEAASERRRAELAAAATAATSTGDASTGDASTAGAEGAGR